MHRRPVQVLAVCLVALGVAAPVLAQSTPTVELSGGYQFLNVSVDDESESLGKGWYFDVAGNLSPMFGLVFQVGGNYKTFEESFSAGGITSTASVDLSVHQFLGGVRLNARSNPKLVLFGQVLFGGINGSVDVSSTTTIPGTAPITFSEQESGTDFAFDVGGGVNFGLTDQVGLRVGADYLRVFEEDAGANFFRFVVGIVINR